MKWRTLPPPMVGLMMGAVLAASPALAQKVTGTPGSPDATTTIDGQQTPPRQHRHLAARLNTTPENRRRGGRRASCPPQLAPNVLLIMTDDVGFGAPSTFGGVIPTPALDRIAEMVFATRTSIGRRSARRRGRR